MDNYFESPPFFNEFTRLTKTTDGFVTLESKTNSEIKISTTNKAEDIDSSDSFKRQIDSSESTVKMIYMAFIDSTIALEREKFIYNEFWNG